MYRNCGTFQIMVKSASVNSRIEPSLKAEAEAIFAQLGLSTSEAISLFYRQVSLHHGLPFEVRLPSKDTKHAMEELESGQGRRYRDFNALLDSASK